MDTARVIVLLLVLLFLLLAPDHHSHSVQHALDPNHVLEEKRLVELLASSRHGDLDPTNGKWLNVTGLREDDGFRWEALATVKKAAHYHLERVLGEDGLAALDQLKLPAHAAPPSPLLSSLDVPLYKNVTGFVKGQWVRSGLDAAPNRLGANGSTETGHVDGPIPSEYQNYVTGSRGKVHVKLDEKRGSKLGAGHGMVREISAVMAIKENDSAEDYWSVKMQGVHFPEHGSVVLTTASDKYVWLQIIIRTFCLIFDPDGWTEKIHGPLCSVSSRAHSQHVRIDAAAAPGRHARC